VPTSSGVDLAAVDSVRVSVFSAWNGGIYEGPHKINQQAGFGHARDRHVLMLTLVSVIFVGSMDLVKHGS